MNYFLLFLGTVILLVAIYDLTFTALSPNGAGFFTNLITKAFYGFFRKICVWANSMKMLENSGTIIIIIILVIWYLTIWLGSSLVICSDPGSVVNSATQLPADVVDKFYYTGFTLSTLGVGDFKASTEAWRIFTIFLSFIGFGLITTGISYMIPALSASVNQRKLGNYISMLGNTPQDILEKHWEGEGFQGLESHFNTLTEMIITHSQQMLAYPVLYCFYTADTKEAGLMNIFKIDEILTILMLNVPPENRPGDQSIYPLREAITYYITIRKEYFTGLEPEEPDVPRMDSLKKTGIPLLHDHDSLRELYKEFADRRKLISAILKDQGRDFSDIYGVDREY